MKLSVNPRIFNSLTPAQKTEAAKELLELRDGKGRSRIDSLAELGRYGIVAQLPKLDDQINSLLADLA